MLKTDSLIFYGNVKYFTAQQILWCWIEKMSVKNWRVSRLEFVSVPIADQLQPNFYKLLCLEQRVTKLDWKSTMHSVVKCP